MPVDVDAGWLVSQLPMLLQNISHTARLPGSAGIDRRLFAH